MSKVQNQLHISLRMLVITFHDDLTASGVTGEMVLCCVCGWGQLIWELLLTLWPFWHMNRQKWKMPKFCVVAAVVPRSQVANRIASGQLSCQVSTRYIVLWQCELYLCSVKGLLYLYLFLLLYVLVQERTDRNVLRTRFEGAVKRGADVVPCHVY